MQQNHFDVFIKGTKYETRFKSMEERERLLDNLVVLRQTLWEMRAHLCQLEGMLEESRHLREETDCLRAQLDSVAESLKLQLVRVTEESVLTEIPASSQVFIRVDDPALVESFKD